MLHWRLIFAAAILAPLFCLLAVDYKLSGAVPGIWLMPFGLLVAILAVHEFLDLVGTRHPTPWSGTVYAGVALIFAATCVPQLWPLSGSPYPADPFLDRWGWPLAAASLAGAVCFFVEAWRFREPGDHVLRVAVGMFALGYIGIPMSFVAALRFFSDNARGMAALLSALLIVKVSDAGAYAAGKLWGRHRMARELSPNKTWEGAAGGLLAGAAVAILFFETVPAWLGNSTGTPVWRSALFGCLLVAAGMVGDLCESLLKRDMARKDSSNWLRGLGGVLDVIDSVLLAAPPAYFCWAIGAVG